MRGSEKVWRALAAARARNVAALGEAPPVPGAPGATRRALLKGLVAAGAAAALPRPAHAHRGGRVAIVGGGIAGLSALHHLREAGVDAWLYEARGRAGGRMFTHRPPGGTAFEMGGQLVNSDHADIQALCRRFGVGLVDRKAEAHRTLVLAEGRVLAEGELAEALRPIAGQIDRDAAWLDRDFTHAAAALDRLSIADYLDRHQSLIGRPWVRQLLETTSRTEYGVEPEEASAVQLIFNLPTVNGQRVEILGESDERYVIAGGSSALIEAMAAAYGGRIAFGKRLAAVEPAAGATRLRFHGGETVEAEEVIVAVPAPLLRQIDWRVPLPPRWRRFVAEMGLGRNEKLQAARPSIPWRAPLGVGGELWQAGDAGWSLGWDGSVRGAGDTQPVWTWFLGGDQVGAAEPADAQAMRFASTAEPAIPGLGEGSGPYLRTNWHAQALTLGAYVNFRPGQITRFAPLLCVESDDPAETRVPVVGRIRFAGEHLSEAFPGYMNGAAQTGRVAAQAITGRRTALGAA